MSLNAVGDVVSPQTGKGIAGARATRMAKVTDPVHSIDDGGMTFSL